MDEVSFNVLTYNFNYFVIAMRENKKLLWNFQSIHKKFNKNAVNFAELNIERKKKLEILLTWKICIDRLQFKEQILILL